MICFRTFDLGQTLLLPPDLRDWLPEGHLARFVAEMVGELDLSAILAEYDGDGRGQGQAAYHPQMVAGLLIYGYCVGIFSSRRIERATFEDVAFRFLSGDQHPDHDTIAAFRERHLQDEVVKRLMLGSHRSGRQTGRHRFHALAFARHQKADHVIPHRGIPVCIVRMRRLLPAAAFGVAA